MVMPRRPWVEVNAAGLVAQPTLRPIAMPLSRSELLDRYLEQLPYAPYPVQEEALLAWFAAEQGVLVCAPTGTGTCSYSSPSK